MHRKLKPGEKINSATDEMKHKKRWYPVVEFAGVVETGLVCDWMKEIRRPLKEKGDE